MTRRMRSDHPNYLSVSIVPGKILIHLTIFLYFAIVFGFQARASDYYVYDDIFNSSQMIVINVTESRINVGDVGRSIEICNSESYFCFSDQYIAFAVPVQDIGTRNEWEYSGVRFINYGARAITFLNSHTDVYLIQATINEIAFRYLYSEKYGLVAIGILDPQALTGRTYLIRGQYGFAHQR